MLIPGQIPDYEPVLHVGLILPEDRKDSVTVLLPSWPHYALMDEHEEALPLDSNVNMHFTVQDGLVDVSINQKRIPGGKTWFIRTIQNPEKLSPESGLLIKEVIAGREFHWRKAINVSIPGSLEIKQIDGYLTVINRLGLEEYLACVATSEMGSACPPALLESQTIVARSWILANKEMKHRDLGFDVCNDDCCQRYQGMNNLTDHAVRSASQTRGKILLFDGNICDARYSKSCGGMTESFETVWGGDSIDYLPVKADAPSQDLAEGMDLRTELQARQWIESIPKTFCSPMSVEENTLSRYLGKVDVEGNYFRWVVRYPQAELTDLLNRMLNLSAKCIIKIDPKQRGGSGRISQIDIYYLSSKDGSNQRIHVEGEFLIRKAFHSNFLYSSAFFVETMGKEIPETFVLRGAGWGHGVGYCQIGALGMALEGYSTAAILEHYFPGAELTSLY